MTRLNTACQHNESWEDELRKTSMAYGGAEECLTALPLRAHELEPGLAPADVSGSITPEMWLDSDMCSFFARPVFKPFTRK